ncbi:MAG: nucleotide exchange factor GrpE [Bdellovibrio sp.]|nr:MAG: nucleotide exchange factor GrpE [Bdellovibrio sp.]
MDSQKEEKSKGNTNDNAERHDADADNKTEKEIEALKKELEKSKKDYLYLRAEFDNFRKQVLKERAEQAKYGGERVIHDILEVMDNFARALSTEINEKNFTSFKEGVQMISKELHNVLERHGVKELEAEGKAFDPMEHEAINSEETNEVPEGHVIQVLKKAYKLHDKLLRPAQVIVAKKPSKHSKKEGE